MTSLFNQEEYTSKYKFINTLVKRGGWLSSESNNYQYRQEQVKMIDSVLDGINEKRNVVVEAPTGTGKSFAYLLAAFDKIIHDNKRVAISTNTINLQEQLIKNDLPFLVQLFEKYKKVKINYELLKGKSNYVCPKKINVFEKDGISVKKKEEIDYIKEAMDWSEKSFDGDKSNAPANVLKVWYLISADEHCPKTCSFESKCPYKIARKRAKDAQLVVLNHHAFVMDYLIKKKGHKGFLGDFDFVVLDEGHHFEKVVIESCGKQVSYYSTISKLNSTIEELEREKRKNKKKKKLLEKAINNLVKLKQKFKLFWDYVKKKVDNSKEQKLTLPHYERVLNQKYLLLVKKVFAKIFKIFKVLLSKKNITLRERTHDKLMKNDAYLRSNYSNFLLIVERKEGKDYAYWAENPNEKNPSLVAKPIDISGKLQDIFGNDSFRTPDNLIFTSATITTNKKFNFFLKNLGLPKNTITKTVKSPFDYKKQAKLYIPEKSLSGTIATRDPNKYQNYVAKNIIKTSEITQRGIFALFTSNSAMKATYEKVKKKLKFHNLLIQGSMNKNLLIEKFKNNKNSILFATYSFWEGVDVKGDNLGYVFIDKIPFDVHTDPLIKAKRDKMTAEGNNFFNDYYVPEAIIKLKQGFGRLIRTKKDYGAVIILDDRMIPGKKAYSKKIYNSFPDIENIFTRNFEEIKELEMKRRKIVPIKSIG